MSKKSQILRLSLSVLALILIVFTERLYRVPLFNYSITYLLELQQYSSTTSLNLSLIVTEFGNTPLFVICSAFIILSDPLKSRAFYHIMFLCTSLWIMNITKMAYHEQRPYFEDNAILPYGSCSVEYGNPSGHSLFACGYGLFLYFDVIYSSSSAQVQMIENLQKWKMKLALWGITSVLFGFIIAYTRIYLRVHTFNQVLYGLLLGCWISITFHFVLRESLMNFLNKIVVDYVKINELYIYSLVSTILVLMGFGTQLLVYFYVNNSFVPNPIWEQNVHKKCTNIALSEYPRLFNDVSLLNSTLILVAYSGFQALLIKRSVYGVMNDQIYETSVKDRIYRIAIQVALVVIYKIYLELFQKKFCQQEY